MMSRPPAAMYVFDCGCLVRSLIHTLPRVEQTYLVVCATVLFWRYLWAVPPINIVLHTIAFHMVDALMTYLAPRVAFKGAFLPGVGCDVRLPEILLKIVLVTFLCPPRCLVPSFSSL